MGAVKIPYYVVKKGFGYWQPTPAMRAQGAKSVPCGKDGPDAWKMAKLALDAWRQRKEAPTPAKRQPPRPGTLRYAYERYRATAEWSAKAVRTREEWERCWRSIGPAFGDVKLNQVTLEDISDFRAEIERQISLREAHRTIKIWRALWKIAAAFRIVPREADPSIGVINVEPKIRKALWNFPEARKLVKQAWRAGYYGLAAVIAVTWDTSYSPVDVRTLTPAQREGDAFRIERAKTGRDAIGTLSPISRRILAAYLQQLGIKIAPTAQIFRNRSGAPYSKDTLGDDFRDVRAMVFGPDEKRTLADFRRSGAVEALIGGATKEGIGAKLGNDFRNSGFLQKTYAPTNKAVVLQVDQARKKARQTKG